MKDKKLISKYSKQELKDLIEQDYKVRNENPHYLIHNDVISIYSMFDGMLWEDCYIEPKIFDCTIREAERMFIDNGFKNCIKDLSSTN
ncbi:hypothetical protein [Clostridium butyricum]|uniref:hypothetical protein n=1 Tax=Clostridium butyricum TaxID=1492 RepID=UPI00374E6446